MSDRSRRSTPLSSKTSNPTPTTRRERRAAARTPGQAKSTASGTRATATTTAKPWYRSPIALITGGVLVVAVIAVVALQLLPGSGHSGPATPGTRTAAGILVPAVGTPTANADGRALGKVDAPVKLIVWSDFQCPRCRDFAQQTEGILATDYVAPGLLRLEYHDMNIIGGNGGESDAASTAARCADQQGKFWQYHDVLFANQAAENSGNFSRKRLDDMADAVGLDRVKFDQCMNDSTAILNDLKASTAQGLTRGNGTPTLDFGGSNVIAGNQPYATVAAMIDKLLAEQGITPPAGHAAPSAGASGAGASGASSSP